MLHTHEIVRWHVWVKSHVNETCYTYEWGMSPIWMSHVISRGDVGGLEKVKQELMETGKPSQKPTPNQIYYTKSHQIHYLKSH